MLENIPMDKQTLQKWLKAGYVEGGKLYPTYRGTPQYPLPVEYKGIRLDCGYRIDMFVEDVLILELRSIDPGRPPKIPHLWSLENPPPKEVKM